MVGNKKIPKNRWFVYISPWMRKCFDEMVANIADGNILVMDEECLKQECCLMHLEWFKEQVTKGKILLEFWLTPDELAEEHLEWHLCGEQYHTYKAESFEKAVAQLPREHQLIIMEWYRFVKDHFKPRETWEQGLFGDKKIYHPNDLKSMKKENGSYGVDFRNVTSTPAITPMEKANFHGCYGFI